MEVLSVTQKEKEPKGFVLPSPQFDKLLPKKSLGKVLPHFLSAQGMLLPRKNQPPPMYGPRGATVPAKFLTNYLPNKETEKTTTTIEQTFEAPVAFNNRHRNPHKIVRSLPRSMCQPCKMSFTNEEELSEHCLEHERCEIGDCEFLGHPTIMDNHIVKEHAGNSTGIYERYKKLNTPEDIARWREERKKKFPTACNIELRRKVREMRLKRGERLESNKSRFAKRDVRKPRFKKFPRAPKLTKPEVNDTHVQEESDSKELKQKTKRRNRKRMPRKKSENMKLLRELAFSDESSDDTRPIVVIPLDSLTDSEENITCDIPMFYGTSLLTDYSREKVKTKIIENPLTNILGVYGSGSSDSESESDEDKPICHKSSQINALEFPIPSSGFEFNAKIRKRKNSNDKEDSNVCSNIKNEELLSEEKKQLRVGEESTNADSALHSSDNEPPEELTIKKSSNEPIRKQPTEPPRKKQKLETPPAKVQQKPIRRSGLDYRKLRIQPPNTMLYKLLESDIRHERNVLLQCVRYVCENNFFGIGSSNATNTTES